MQILKAARGNVTGHFGDTNVPGANVKRHGGMDIGHGNKTDADLRVVAPASGRVIFAGKSGTYGLCIIIGHGNGYESLLAHLEEVLVHVGFEVTQGQSVAVMGDSGGDWAVHLHQELRRNGVQLDPETYLAAPAGGGTTPIKIGSKLMPPQILFGDETGQAFPYLFNPYTGKRTSLSAHQLSVYRESANPPQERTIGQAGFDLIPKEAGSQ